MAAVMCFALQDALAQRAQRYGRNVTRRPREATFWELLLEALQVPPPAMAKLKCVPAV